MKTGTASRIALVVTELRPGGMERLVVHLALGLANSGVNVQVFCLHNQGVLASLLLEQDVPVIALHSPGSKDVKALYTLTRKLRHFRPTLVHVHDYASLPYVAVANLFATRRPLLFTAHGLLYEGFEPLRKRLRFFSRFLTAISAVSEKVAERHRTYLGWVKDMAVISNGVPSIPYEAEQRHLIREEFGCTADTCVFLAVGNPRPEKALEDLLDAAALLREKEQNFFIAIAGALADSAYCQGLLNKLEQLNLTGRCRFLGFRDDTAALYSAADVFVLSSRSEGLPMVILEAMAAGLPVISTDVGGIAAAVGDHLLLVEAQHPALLAAELERLLRDTQLRDQLAQRGRSHVEKYFGAARMVEEYLEWYRLQEQRVENSELGAGS